EIEAAYRASITQATEAGAKVLEKGGSALDAIEAAIQILEDDPLFNAGRGAVFTAEGKNELDAAIMDGSNLKAGAVAGVTRTRHPISMAREPTLFRCKPAWSKQTPVSFSRRAGGNPWSINSKRKAARRRRDPLAR